RALRKVLRNSDAQRGNKNAGLFRKTPSLAAMKALKTRDDSPMKGLKCNESAGPLKDCVPPTPVLRKVTHQVDVNDRPEVKEPTPNNKGRNNVHTGGSGKHKAKRLRGSQARRAKEKAESRWGFGKHKRSDTVLTTTPCS